MLWLVHGQRFYSTETTRRSVEVREKLVLQVISVPQLAHPRNRRVEPEAEDLVRRLELEHRVDEIREVPQQHVRVVHLEEEGCHARISYIREKEREHD